MLDSFGENCRGIFGHLEEVTLRLVKATSSSAPELISGPAALGDRLLSGPGREG